MKLRALALKAVIAQMCLVGVSFGQTGRLTRPVVSKNVPVSYEADDEQTLAPIESAPAQSAPIESAPAPMQAQSVGNVLSDNCDRAPGCDTISCDSMGCDSMGGCGAGGLFGLGILDDGRTLTDPWKLLSEPICGITLGGWTSVGYHTQANPASFNTYPDRVQLGQQWLYAEKIADGSEGLGLGGRIDYVYGTDAPDTQAFGIPNNHFDNGWDNNNNTGYGHAMPQLYGEVAMGDLSVKVGHFFTIIGNEVVQSTGNFFYSRQFTFYNAEPFTHTGALTTFNLDEDTQLYNGYVMGWDSGFEDNGDAYIGGFKRKLNDKWTAIYTNALGRFGSGNLAVGERGRIHSVILTGALTDKLTYINQADVLYTTNQTGGTQRNTFGNIHYLVYQATDRVALGQRFEWFNFGGDGFNSVQNDDLYNYTLGVNYRAHANLLVRPEVRWVWDREQFGFNENSDSTQTAFGGDMVFTF
ncbi:MAG: porin [Pirellulaceae bacterium]|nr:porin [Pirellulaceae bacterium]